MARLREPFPGRGDRLTGRFEPGIERLLTFGLVGQPTRGVVFGGDEFLQGDDAFEIRIHRSEASF
jgi:hypothetical protein